MAQLADLDDIADIDETAPHGILELALLGGLEPAVELLLPSRVAPHARGVQGAVLGTIRPGRPRAPRPQQQRP